MYRIQWLGPAVIVLILSIGLILITPSIKKILIKLISHENYLAPTVITMRELQQYSFLLPTHTQIEETEEKKYSCDRYASLNRL